MILLPFAFSTNFSLDLLIGVFSNNAATIITTTKALNTSKSRVTISHSIPPTVSRIALIAYVNGKNG